LSLRSDNLDSVGELYTEDNFGQLVVTIEATPASLGGLGELEDHGERGLVREASLGAHLQLASYGVGFHSYTEAHLGTDNELVRNILLALLASLAKVEAQKISERTRAGMARARAQGKRIGRPPISAKLKAQIIERIAGGDTPYRVAQDLGIDRHTAAKYGAAV
jgi:hypothetical protein